MWDHSPAACRLPSHHDRLDPSTWCKNLLIRKLGELFDEDSPRLHPEGAGAESGLTLHARQRPLIHWRSKRDEIRTDAPRRDRPPAQPSEAAPVGRIRGRTPGRPELAQHHGWRPGHTTATRRIFPSIAPGRGEWWNALAQRTASNVPSSIGLTLGKTGSCEGIIRGPRWLRRIRQQYLSISETPSSARS